MAKFQMKELIDPNVAAESARLGAGVGTANWVSDAEVGKLVKLVGDSRYNLCAAGDAIEAYVASVESAHIDDYSFGTVRNTGRKAVVLDGLQATPGTGAIAIGDYVVCGTVVAKGTALTASAKVCKATIQPGTTAATVTDVTPAGVTSLVNNVAAHIAASMFKWRLVAASGTAVGSTGVIERVL